MHATKTNVSCNEFRGLRFQQNSTLNISSTRTHESFSFVLFMARLLSECQNVREKRKFEIFEKMLGLDHCGATEKNMLKNVSYIQSWANKVHSPPPSVKPRPMSSSRSQTQTLLQVIWKNDLKFQGTPSCHEHFRLEGLHPWLEPDAQLCP